MGETFRNVKLNMEISKNNNSFSTPRAFYELKVGGEKKAVHLQSLQAVR